MEIALGIVSLFVAGWAAYNAHEARKWQRNRDRERRATNVRVELEQLAETARTLIGKRPKGHGVLWHVVKVIAINDGETTEYVRDLAIENDNGQGLTLIDDQNLELPPRGRVAADVNVRDPREGFDFESSLLHGWVRLASGAQFQSEPEGLDQVILDHVKEWNGRLVQ